MDYEDTYPERPDNRDETYYWQIPVSCYFSCYVYSSCDTSSHYCRQSSIASSSINYIYNTWEQVDDTTFRSLYSATFKFDYDDGMYMTWENDEQNIYANNFSDPSNNVIYIPANTTVRFDVFNENTNETINLNIYYQ